MSFEMGLLYDSAVMALHSLPERDSLLETVTDKRGEGQILIKPEGVDFLSQTSEKVLVRRFRPGGTGFNRRKVALLKRALEQDE